MNIKKLILAIVYFVAALICIYTTTFIFRSSDLAREPLIIPPMIVLIVAWAYFAYGSGLLAYDALHSE